jgi:hypothetical protein
VAKAVRVRVSSSAPNELYVVLVLSLIKKLFAIDFLAAVADIMCRVTSMWYLNTGGLT